MLFIPKLNFNIISIGQLCDLCCEVTFFSSSCRVQDPRTVLLLLISMFLHPLHQIYARLLLLLLLSRDFNVLVAIPSLNYVHSFPKALQVLLGKSFLIVLHVKQLRKSHYLFIKVLLCLLVILILWIIMFRSRLPHQLYMGSKRYFVIFIYDYSRFTWIYSIKTIHSSPKSTPPLPPWLKLNSKNSLKFFIVIMLLNIVTQNFSIFFLY